MEEIIKRIQHLISEYFDSQIKFAEIIEVSPQTVNRWFRSEGIGLEMINRMVHKIPDLNIAWLMLGEGEVFKKGTKMANEPRAKYRFKDSNVEDLRAHIESQKKQINSLEGQILFLQDLIKRDIGSKLGD